LVESGTHVLFGSQLDAYGTGGITLAKLVLPRLRQGLLCLADRRIWENTCKPHVLMRFRVCDRHS